MPLTFSGGLPPAMPQHAPPSAAAKRVEVTLAFIRSKSPCSSGYRWLLRNMPSSDDYQAVLDALVADDRAADAAWLLEQLGPTNEVLRVDNLSASALVFAGTVECRGNVEVSGLLRVGRTLQVDGGLRVEGDARIGDELRVGGALHGAGDVQVGAQARIGWSLNVQGSFTCQGRVRVGWGADIGGRTHITGRTEVGHALTVGDDFACDATVTTGDDFAATGAVDVRQGIVSAGSVQGTRQVQAGWGIRAAHDILSNGAIRAGETLQAGGRIAAGAAYGIYAGLATPIDAWPSSGFVTAASPPERLLSGCWCAP
jgi:cytoskeletal protein CcmA (bactofilin family)